MGISRVYNFNPGPATLPLSVLEKARDTFMEFGGMSILEISHRSREFGNIIERAESLIREHLELPDSYRVLFIQGGATIHFGMVPLNLLDERADFSITGHWSKRALEEANRVGKTRVVFSDEENGFVRTPRQDELEVDGGADYLHITTNNTIFGTEYAYIPDTGKVPLVADMSSDILSKRIDVKKFALIYAGAQKNLGPAGISLAIIRDDLLEKLPRDIPTMLTYRAHAAKKSLYNTPPTFTIYCLMLVLEWIREQGGIDAIEKINREKAKLIYDALDASSLYEPHARKDSRSLMNITFRLGSDDLTTRFVKDAAKQDLVGLKGHRSVGGIRASIYNAFPLEGVEKLVEFMKEFERKA
jgi:phosphoserine aminotransferase